MTSFAKKYAAGQFAELWREMDQNWASFSESIAFEQGSNWQRSFTVDREDAEDVLRQTFERVAHNSDLLIQRLRETGYRFECESGRYGPPVSPRQSAVDQVALCKASLEADFGDLYVFDKDLSPFPLALERFGQIVGTLDLVQRFPPSPPIDLGALKKKPRPEGFELPSGFSSEEWLSIANSLSAAAETYAPEKTEQQVQLEQELDDQDRKPHPHASDPVLSRLGDWDPLTVSFEYLSMILTDEEAEPQILSSGGLAYVGGIAASFEHKANISGAEDVSFDFPSTSLDPLITSEGIKMPFTTYLRRAFARGGFFGVPRPVHNELGSIREVEQGIFLPDHPVFASLKRDFMPF